MELSVDAEGAGAPPVLHVSGELDVWSAPELGEELGELIAARPPRVVVDLLGTAFMDSAALGVLVAAFKRLRAGGGSMAVVATSEPLLRLFAVTGLSQVLGLHRTVAEALEST